MHAHAWPNFAANLRQSRDTQGCQTSANRGSPYLVARCCTYLHVCIPGHILSYLVKAIFHDVASRRTRSMSAFSNVRTCAEWLCFSWGSVRGIPRRGDDQGMPGGGQQGPQTMTPSLYTFVRISTRPYHLSMKVSETPHDVAERTMPPLSKVFCTIGRLFVYVRITVLAIHV